jgi:hypothetical protein
MYTTPKYWKSPRNLRAGPVYEALVAEQLRSEGWKVAETGQSGYNDHGIDLIASKDGTKRYVQCKGWRHSSHIHENVVTQLYGSVASIEGTDNLEGVEKVIYSPATLDDTAEATAKRLGILFVRLDFPEDSVYAKRKKWYKPHHHIRRLYQRRRNRIRS